MKNWITSSHPETLFPVSPLEVDRLGCYRLSSPKIISLPSDSYTLVESDWISGTATSFSMFASGSWSESETVLVTDLR